MAQSENNQNNPVQAGEILFDFAVERDDVKTLVAHLPVEAKCRPTAVEYELQLLKIVSTGWALSFFLESNPYKTQLTEKFWKRVHRFSGDLSETTALMTGQKIDYFQILRDRMDQYVAALYEKPETGEPAAVVGPEFAKLCGDEDDVFTVLAGSRMFIMTVARVREFLDYLNLD